MKTWILVADSGRARLFETAAKDGEMFEVGAFTNPQARVKASDEGRDRPPRVQESASSGRHSIEPHTDPHDKTAEEFAHGLADMLDQGRTGHEYTRLMLVAPPRFLGQLKSALDEQVAKLLVQTLSKDYTRAGVDEIRAVLDEVGV